MESVDNYTIKEVTEDDSWFWISTTKSSCFGIRKKWGKIPKAGDLVTLYTRGFSFIRGIDLNGERLFYKTDEELETDRLERLAAYEKEKQERFEREKEQMDADYAALPEFFKARIDKFRANNPDFRKDYESYELFCCKEALKIAEACPSRNAIIEFRQLSFEEQKTIAGIDDGHSGNTFGCACSLAVTYLESPDSLVNVNGALAPLVGSAEYGDFPKENV